VKDADEPLKFFGIAGLGEEGVGAEGVGTVDIADFLESAQHDGQQTFDRQFVAFPFENFEAVSVGHVDVEKQNSGKGVLAAIRVDPFSAQVSNNFAAGPDDASGIDNAGLGKGTLEQKQIVRTILCNQNETRRHRVTMTLNASSTMRLSSIDT
jgi:hypothetical protein